MSNAIGDLSGAQKAALLLMTLGEDEASEVLKHMNAGEVQSLGTAMASLTGVTKELADSVLDFFISDVEEQAAFGVGTQEYVRNILTSAFGAKKADTFIDRILIGHDVNGLDTLKWMSSTDVFDIIDGEHPQIVAIVVAFLEPDQAAKIIDLLPAEQRADVIMRIAKLSDIQQSALAEIENLIAAKSTDSTSTRSEKVGGDKVAANIINALDAAKGEEILDAIKETNEEMSERIKEMMFVFETLLNVDDRGIQALLREISNDLLVLALKGCDPAVSEKILGNMSKRAATLLAEDMEAKGPTRLAEVEEAQKEILEVARRLAESGDIDLGQSGEEYV